MNWRPFRVRAYGRSASVGVIGALMLALLPGCFSLGRDAPALEQYVIGGAPLSDTLAPVPGVDGVTIGVRRLDLAPYLAAPAIVVRRGIHEIVTSDFHRWGEDPADGINRALARYLADVGPFRAVDVAPWPVRSRYDFLIRIHVTRFEGVVPGELSPTAGATAGTVEGAAHVRASWEIIRQEDETVLARGDTEYREEGWAPGDYAGLVALLDQGLAVLARDVAGVIGGLVAAGTGPE